MTLLPVAGAFFARALAALLAKAAFHLAGFLTEAGCVFAGAARLLARFFELVTPVSHRGLPGCGVARQRRSRRADPLPGHRARAGGAPLREDLRRPRSRA